MQSRSFLHLFAYCALLLSLGTLTRAATIKTRATVCNGAADLCGRSYGSVSFVGTHDSYAVGVNNLAVNQDYDITQQLTDGVRMLQAQVHNEKGVLQLCHTTCSLFNGGTLASYLGKVKTWMSANPNEVVTLLLVNIDNQPPSSFASVFKSAGVDSLSYSPPSASLPVSGWPTLGAMIDASTRLVTFLDNQADFTAVPYLIDEFTNMWETAFDVIDPTFDCNVNRTKGDPSSQLYLINHFLDKLFLGNPAPDVSKANVTNAASGPGSLGAQVDTCKAANGGRSPNFLLVDFYEFGGGSVFQVAAGINGVQYNPTTPIVTPKTSANATATKNGSQPVITSVPLSDGAGSVTIQWSLLGLVLLLTLQ